MTSENVSLTELVAQRKLLECRACGGMIWHFDVQDAPSAIGPVILLGYRCATCSGYIHLLTLDPALAHGELSDTQCRAAAPQHRRSSAAPPCVNEVIVNREKKVSMRLASES